VSVCVVVSGPRGQIARSPRLAPGQVVPSPLVQSLALAAWSPTVQLLALIAWLPMVQSQVLAASA